ncbi:MAG: M56 family metallopeptidase [Oscillospiraceae bacterium]|nr:M56 family metallopeptidase [Oscillospiraceae bacterium]
MTALEQILFRLVVAVVVGLMAAGMIAVDRSRFRSMGLQYAPDRYVEWAPVCFLVFALLIPLRPSKTGQVLNEAFSLLCILLLLTVLLLLLTPRLRRHFSARTCAGFWVLPGLAGYLDTYFGAWKFEWEPFFVIRLPRSALRIMLWTWLAGVCGVMLWRLLSHLFYRKRILEHAVRAESWEYGLLAEVYQSLAPSAQGLAKRRKSAYYSQCRQVEAILDHRHMLRSPEVSTPLTIGLTKKNTFLVLPDRAYSRDELALILRHEVVHLLHGDISTKLSLSLLCAAGWFIPSLWFGMEFVSEDLELCCDEMVTEGMGKEQRRNYAGLLLQTPGSERGFTSCLSASARGFRYRLKRVLRPKRREGELAGLDLLFLGLIAGLVIFFSGAIGIREEVGTVQNVFLDEGWSISAVQFPRITSHREESTDPTVLESIECQLRDVKLEQMLWKDNHRLSSYNILSYTGGDYLVTLTRSDGEKKLLKIFSHAVAVYKLDENGNETGDPTVYLTDGKLLTIEN